MELGAECSGPGLESLSLTFHPLYLQKGPLDLIETGKGLKVQTDKPHLVSLGSGRLSTAITLLPLEEGKLRAGRAWRLPSPSRKAFLPRRLYVGGPSALCKPSLPCLCLLDCLPPLAGDLWGSRSEPPPLALLQDDVWHGRQLCGT